MLLRGFGGLLQPVQALVGLDGDFREQIVEDHQITVLPGKGRLVHGNIGDVIDVVLFGGTVDHALPGALGQGFLQAEGTQLPFSGSGGLYLFRRYAITKQVAPSNCHYDGAAGALSWSRFSALL